MPTLPSSSVGQLLYAATPGLCFARLVSDLDAALEAATDAPRILTWDHEDVAKVDYDATRIVLGYCEDVPPPWAACLTVSVGNGPQTGESLLPERQARLVRMIADRISARHPPDHLRWLTLPAVMDAEVVDALISALGDSAEAARIQEPEPAPAARPDRFPPVDAGLVEAADARTRAVLADRKAERDAAVDEAAGQGDDDRTRGRRRRDPARSDSGIRPRVRRLRAAMAAPPDPAAVTPANDLPQVPVAEVAEAARIRAALYDPLPDDRPRHDSVPIRLAAHTMNATLMMVSLPIGASVMTYSLLRGENLRLSARAMALLGAAIGLTQGMGGMFGGPLGGLL
ncbi:MAG: hypothetical protein IT542_05855 [Rubellimicrobium sp.]|nr:hypothetical protein [Rubellimicrobium sp.]